MSIALTEMESLIIAQALFKALSAAVSTKDPDNLRGRIDARAIESYLATGAKSFDLKLNGTKVGSFTVRLSKPVHRNGILVQDQEAYLAWCVENGHAQAETTYKVKGSMDGWGKPERDALDLLLATGAIEATTVVNTSGFSLDSALKHFEETGELPDGCTLEVIDEPSVPIGTLLKVDPALVAQAMGKELPNAVAGLLSEGAELS